MNIEDLKITVCDKCLMASCWAGEFMCQEAQTAGLTKMFVKDLRKLNLEHEHHWINQLKEQSVIQ